MSLINIMRATPAVEVVADYDVQLNPIENEWLHIKRRVAVAYMQRNDLLPERQHRITTERKTA